jgi:septal ring factor EnvC (AmiA/AmiB activator)
MAAEPPKSPSGAPSPGTPAPGAASGAAPDAPADPNERIDGLRSWLAQLERKLNIRTIAIGVIAVLALAGAIYGIVLARDTDKNAATEAQLEDVREELAAVSDTASEAAQDDVRSIEERISALEEDLAAATQGDQKTEQQISVLQDDIQDLRDQIAELESAGTTTTTTTTEETP